MPSAPLPPHEQERLAALRSYAVLDTQAEGSFDNLVRFAAKITGTPIALVSLIDGDRQWFKARVGLETAETHRDLAFCAHAILNPHEALIVEDATRDPRFADNALVTGAPDIRFYAGVPLVTPQGHALGTLCVIDRTPRTMDAEQREALTSLAETVCTTLELRRAMNQIREFAMTDALTGIANRPAFLEGLDRAISRLRRHGDPFALVYFDLDGFKRVNDTLGHAAGDDVLRKVAQTLATSLRREDISARIGGDEFAALLVGGEVDGAVGGERVRAAVKDCMDAHGWSVTASVGVVTFLQAPEGVAEALTVADDLMYGAKAAGKNRVRHKDYTLAAGSIAAG
jgi:diguanylate cyclase (GGDEF)-like protein